MATKEDELRMNNVKEKYEEFVEALREHESFNSRRLPFDPVQCSWQEVMIELENATKAARLNQQGDRKFFTKNRRKLSSLSKSIVPLLDAIPDDLCVLHGGLAIIFHLAAQRESVRRGILDAFEDIPTIIAVACNKSQRFPSDLRLERSIEDLKTTLFVVIPDLVRMLMPDTFVAKVTSLFRGFDVPDTLALIKRKSLAVDSLARDLQDELVFETCVTTREIQAVTSSTHTGVEEIQVAVSKLQDLLSENIMIQEYKDEHLQARHGDKLFRTGTECTVPGSIQELRPEGLIALLSVPHEQCACDLDFVIRQSNQFHSTSRSYGAAITSKPRFQTWINEDYTDMIFVEGHFDSRFGRISPISSFCASLAKTFKDTKVGVALCFFCGQHVASNDSLRGPRGLVRSLLWQLLHVWPKASVHVNILGCFGDEASIPMEDLCFLFQMLLRQVPDLAVFCIIDDLAQFEKYCWDEDYCHFLRTLGSLVGQEPSIRFKVLITSSGKSRRMQEQIPEGRCIRVTERDLIS